MEDELQAGETRKIPKIRFRESCQEMTQASFPLGGEGSEHHPEGGEKYDRGSETWPLLFKLGVQGCCGECGKR